MLLYNKAEIKILFIGRDKDCLFIGINHPDNLKFIGFSEYEGNKIKLHFSEKYSNGTIISKIYIVEITDKSNKNLIDKYDFIPICIKTPVIGYKSGVLLIKSSAIGFGVAVDAEFYDEKIPEVKYKCTYE